MGHRSYVGQSDEDEAVTEGVPVYTDRRSGPDRLGETADVEGWCQRQQFDYQI